DIFIDKKSNEYFQKVHDAYISFINIHSNSVVYAGEKLVFLTQRKFDKITSKVRMTERADVSNIEDLLKKFLNACQKFEKYIFNQKNNFEKHYL
ncbi:hypothetical protein ACFL7M_14405, partial [Thermodesulfobacteriota bacterium]